MISFTNSQATNYYVSCKTKTQSPQTPNDPKYSN